MATYLPGDAARRLPVTGRDGASMRQLSLLLDQMVRVGPVSFGLDGILGLIPGIGDALSSLLSAFIVMKAAQDGVPRATLARMVANVAIDSLLGSIPVIGDLFDFMFKANLKNMQLYEQSMKGGRRTRGDWVFVVAVIVLVLALLTIPVVAGVYVISRLLN
jgi:hypothetical protein